MNNYGQYNPPYTGNIARQNNAQQSRRRTGDGASLGSMEGAKMQTMNPTPQRSQSIGGGNHSQQEVAQQGTSSPNVTMQFSANANPMDGSVHGSMMDFNQTQQNNSLSQFAFNPSMSNDFTQGVPMTGQYGGHMGQMQTQGDDAGLSLSIDTQYSNMMDFNGMSAATANFQSPFDTDMSNSFMGNMSNMPMDMVRMNDEEIAAINDMFSQQQFGSPSFASPMAATFDTAIYGPTQDTNAGAMQADSQMETSNQSTTKIGFPATESQQATEIQQDESQQEHTTQASVAESKSQPATSAPAAATTTTAAMSTTTSARTKKSQAPQNETIGGITLPWVKPAEGWPSSMQGRKSHMEGQYRDVYAPSGFDLMGTLIAVATRPNPHIHLGAVDLSCAFVVCDARAHDNPIIYCSDSFERMTGYTKYEIEGQNCRFLQSPDGRVEAGITRKYCDDESVLYLKNCVNTKAEAQISLINYRKGGQPFMNLLTMVPIVDSSGEVYRFVGFQVDLVENPHAVSGRNPDGTFAMNYKRSDSLPSYRLAPPDPATLMEHGQSISRDEVSTLLSTLASSDNELSKRMVDKMILENSDDVIHVLSLKGLFLYLSPSCGKVLEYDPTELVGMALSSVCHPSDIVPVTRELKETQSGSAVSVVFRIRRKQSGYVWFESHGCLHTEQGKGRKCIILVGRTRPVYTLSKQIVETAGGIGDHEMWSKMSTNGMFLYVSEHVKGLLDKHAEELIGINIQTLMRQDSKEGFNRMLSVVATGQRADLRHEVINRRGQVLQAHTWLYPGDASEGRKPTFVIAQTRLIKYNRTPSRPAPKVEASTTDGSIGTTTSLRTSNAVPSHSHGSKTAHSITSTTNEEKHKSSKGVIVSRAGALATPLGEQDESLASVENAFDELKTTRSSSWQFELRQLERRNRLLTEEVQQLLTARKKRKRRRGAGMMQKDCANCHTTSTPEWRRGPSGSRDLCNSCGLRWAKQQGRVSPRTTSPRHSLSNGSSNKDQQTTLQTAQENVAKANAANAVNYANSTLAKDGSGNSHVSTKDITSASPTSAPDKHSLETASDNPNPQKVARKSMVGLPNRIEEEDESAEQSQTGNSQ